VKNTMETGPEHGEDAENEAPGPESGRARSVRNPRGIRVAGVTGQEDPLAPAAGTSRGADDAESDSTAGGSGGTAPPRGAFVVFLDLDSSGEPANLRLKPRDGLGGDVPAEQASLAAQILGVERDLACIFEGAQWRARERAFYLRDLRDIAEIGLGADAPQVGVATQMLEGLKREVVMREAGPFKAKTLRKLGKYGAAVAGGALAIALLAEGMEASAGATPPAWLNDPDYPLIRSLALLVAGCSVGVWLSVGMRRPTVEFDELAKDDQDRLGPGIRLAFAGALTLVLAAMFHAGVLELAIGGLRTSAVFTSPLVAVLVGVFCGLSEQALSARVLGQANQFVRGTERAAGA
jgi:hypothetical protein